MNAKQEYLRRNMIHCSAVGAEYNARAALERLKRWRNPPIWLVSALQGIIERCEKVEPEMAKYRDEALCSMCKAWHQGHP